jgi:PAS domain S-box-containing protein
MIMMHLFLLIAFAIGLISGFFLLYFYKKRKCNSFFVKQWEDTFNAISEPIAIMDENGMILRYNKPMIDFLQIEPDLFKDKHCFEIIHHTHTHIENCPLVRSKNSHKREEMKLDIGDKSFIISVYPIFNKKGNATEYIHLMKDITDYNKISEALKENEEKFRALANSTTAAIFIYQNNKFVYGNPATYELTGYSENEFLTLNFWDVVHPDFREFVKERGLNRLKGIPQPPNYDFKIVQKNGESRWIKFSSGFLTNYKGATAAIGTAIDITDLIDFQEKLQESISQLEEGEKHLKMQNEEYISLNEELKETNQQIQKLNEELIVSKEKAESSDRLKTSFLNNISHEIRTPLNAILGFSDLMKKKKLTEDKHAQYLNVITASGKQLLNVISNIINVATIEAGEEKIYYKKVNLNALIEQNVQALKPLMANKNLDVSYIEKLPNDKAMVLTDETKLQQIITNLLTNAIKFTENGYVHISCSQNNGKLEFLIKDTGPGISEEFLPYIFERFVQENGLIKKHIHSGMGLGLSLSKSYVKLLGGNIEVRSAVGKGSEFYFSIPYLPIDEEILDVNAEKLFYFSTSKKILMVEDINTNADLIKEYLAPYPFQIIHATNGIDAIELVKENNDINLILMDIKMPEMNGYEACKQILELASEIPIIGLTAYNQENEIKKMKECGMKGYLTKPIEKEVLLIELEKWFNG